MNKRKEWAWLLAIANEELAKDGYSIAVTDPEEGFYRVDILKDGVEVENYAENYYEDELDDLITEVWHYVKRNLVPEG